MRIEGNDIVFSDHIVRLVVNPEYNWPSDFIEDSVVDMAESLDPNGSASVHEHELELMNNDGSWVVIRKAKAKRSTQ